MTLEVWGPRFVTPWGNVFSGSEPPLVVLPDPTGEGRAPADVIVNGRAEFRRGGQSPVLQAGDVLCNPLGEGVFLVPSPQTPRWTLRRAPDEPREAALELLERQAGLSGVELSAPRAAQLLGAARAWLLGSLRCQWHRGFVVEARWSSAATVRDSMAWHLWQVLASPAGVGLERFSGTPVDAADLKATLEVVLGFPAPRLKEVVLEQAAAFDEQVLSGVTVRRAPLPWLRVDAAALPKGVTVEGATNRPRLRWRQLHEVCVNGQQPEDRCLWHDGLWLELRGGDQVTWPGGALTVAA